MTDTTYSAQAEPASSQAEARRRRSRALSLAGAIGIALFLIGAGIGAGAMRLAQRDHAVFDPTLSATRIADLSETWAGPWPSTRATVEGRVAEIFGNKFVLQDASGRALVDTGPGGERGSVVKADEQVTVQGRFERGLLRASAIRFADARIEALGPPGPPHRHGPHLPRF